MPPSTPMRFMSASLNEEVPDREADVGEREWRHDLARPVKRHARVPLGARLTIDLDSAGGGQEQPELGYARSRVQARLDDPVEADRRVRDLDGKQDVLVRRVLDAI